MYIGIDIGGMSIKAGVVDENGKILAKHSVQTPLDGNDSFMAAILESIELALKEAKVGKSAIKSIGIGYPGAVDRDKGIRGEYTDTGISSEEFCFCRCKR